MSLSISISNNSKILAAFAIACTITVGLVNELTKNRIAQQQQKQLLKQFNSIISEQRYNNELAFDCTLVRSDSLGDNESKTAYLARLNGEPVATAIMATAPDGYNGSINLLVAVNIDGSISGARVLSHKETPGLGDKIELRKNPWITSFAGQVIEGEQDKRWAVVKDGGIFDQFTGATITPRAVVKAIKKAAIYVKNNQTQLFNAENACRKDQQDNSENLAEAAETNRADHEIE